MRQLYLLAVGPLAWAAFAVFVLGSAWRLWSMFQLAKAKDGPFLSYMSWKYGLRSILHWLTPYGALGWRENPALCAATFTFHLGMLLLPVFALAHVAMLDQYHGIRWWTPPEWLVDNLTLLVLACLAFFGARRLFLPQVRYVTSSQDWLVLLLTALPFASGWLAHNHIGPPLAMATLHVVSGEALLAAIPFTRLAHMIFGAFERAYMGSEFGGVRLAKDW